MATLAEKRQEKLIAAGVEYDIGYREHSTKGHNITVWFCEEEGCETKVNSGYMSYLDFVAHLVAEHGYVYNELIVLEKNLVPDELELDDVFLEEEEEEDEYDEEEVDEDEDDEDNVPDKYAVIELLEVVNDTFNDIDEAMEASSELYSDGGNKVVIKQLSEDMSTYDEPIVLYGVDPAEIEASVLCVGCGCHFSRIDVHTYMCPNCGVVIQL